MKVIGKYEREALERERQDLLGRRAGVYGGLSAMEGKRLDELERLLGPSEPRCLSDDALGAGEDEESGL